MDGEDPLRVPEAPRPGDEVGAYRLVAELGAGGMGRVFLAEHLKLGRRVALKILQPELWHNRRSVQRFFQEARLVNRIDHENIVEIYDYVQDADGLSYLIMELLVGHDLTQSREQVGPFTLARAVPILRQIAAALAAAHAEDVVHRDLKPGNVFLVQKGSKRDFVKLLDFGIAKLQDDVNAEGVHTRTGAIVGTPLYMSPEQASGDKVDARSDQYSLGVVAFWMLADSFPFKAKSFAELLQKQQSERPAELPLRTAAGDPIPHELAVIVNRCLERDPGARFANAGELEAALAALVTQTSSADAGRAVAAVAPAETAARRAKRSPFVFSLLAMVLGMAVAGGAFLIWQRATAPALDEVDATLPPHTAPAPAATPAGTAADVRRDLAQLPPVEQAPELPAAEPGTPASHRVRDRQRANDRKPGGKHPSSHTPAGDDDVIDPFQK